MKKFKLLIYLMLVIMLVVAGCSPQSTSTNGSVITTDVKDARIHFIDVGQGDSILFESNGHYMLVDAGENDKGTIVVDYLKSLDITSLDYVIGTHPHSDHIGGLDTVINSFQIGSIIMPAKEHTTKTFEDVLVAIQANNLKITKPKVGDTYELGNANFTIIAPNKEYGDDLNNWSVGIKFTYGNNSVVSYGDAELEAEYDISENGIDIKADLLKVGHHGSSTSTSEPILEAVQPKYAVIQSEEGNSYGHPHREIIESLENAGVVILRNDEMGTIIATSDGETITISSGLNSSKSETNKDTESNKVKESTKAKDTMVHITETGKKYHVSGCQYLKESDKEITLKEAKKLGLESCGKCKPEK